MGRSWNLRCNGNWDNDGWSVVGGNEPWEAWNNQDDNKYCKPPSYKGRTTVTFPIDDTTLPAGAVIDSVTVWVRMKTSAGTGPRSVTVNVISSSNTSQYTTRSIYATSAFANHQIGTYTKDPTGKSWDIHRINKLRLRLYCVNGVADSIRVAEAWVEVNYHVRAKVVVVAPSGTTVSPSPTVDWTYTHEEAELQAKAEVRVFTAEQVNVSTFDPDVAGPVFARMLTGSGTNLAINTTLNNGGYRVYVRAWSEKGAVSLWAFKSFTVAAPSPGIPGDDNAGDSGTPGVGVPTAIPDTYTSSAQIRMRDASNLLSVQQADFEVATDPLEWVGAGCTLVRSTSQAFAEGEASMSMTATAAATFTAETNLVEVAANVPLTLRAQVKSAVTARTVSMYVDFYDESYSLITQSAPSSVSDSASTWTEVVGTVLATPVNAVYAKLTVSVASPANGEVHYLDRVGMMYGIGSAWTDGGHTSRNLLTSFLATGDDPQPVSDAWEQANIATTAQRVSTTGTGANGLIANQMTYGGVSSQIAFRSAGTVFTTPTSGTNFTLNKPAGTTNNDLLLAFVTSTEHGAIIPPAGWTTVNTASVDDGTTDVALFVLKRTAISSDPSSWTTGNLTASSSRRTAVVLCYTGAAHADDQFVAENVRTDTSGATTHRTQTVINSDPNAWRVAAFAASDDAASGAYTANVTPPSAPAPIQFVGASQKWVQHGNTGTYTINKPTGLKSGDLMIASVVFSGEINTVNAPSGWTLVRRTHKEFPNSSGGDAHSGDVTHVVFKRTAGSSEPNSWSASHTDWGQPKVSQVVAYRNCAVASEQFLAEGSASRSNASTVTTPEVSNSDSRAWRVCAFGATTPFKSSWSDGDSRERCDSSSDLDNFPDAVLQFSDSNGQVATGTHKRTGRINSVSNRWSNVPSGNFFTAVGWIGIIKPLASPPAQGGNETERVDNNNGSSNPRLSTAVYDSNGIIPAGTTSVYGQFTPGSGSSANAMASWIGILKPASEAVAGYVSARTNRTIDISDMEENVLDLAGNKMTVIASFLGSSDGTPVLGLEFWRANQYIATAGAIGTVFNTSSWTKTWATFAVPEGTTRVRPVLSAADRAVNETVMFDRVAVMLGGPLEDEIPAWRNGTARPEHPVWSKPLIQYTDDTGIGFASWVDLPGQRIIPPEFRTDTGQLAYVDHSIIPLNVRKYRVQTISYGLQGDLFASGWGPESNEVSFTALNWWLKDFSDLGSSLRAYIKSEAIAVGTENTAVTYQPLGEAYPVVLSEGYKADTVQLTFITGGAEHGGREGEAQLAALLRSGRTLFLQSDQDYAWWVRPVGVLNTQTLLTGRRTEEPIKEITVQFVQVRPEE